MEQPIKKDIIHILRKALTVVKREDVPELLQLSDYSIKDASIFQDKDSIKIATVVYALSKIIPRSESRIDDWDNVKKNV